MCKPTAEKIIDKIVVPTIVVVSAFAIILFSQTAIVILTACYDNKRDRR